MYRAAPRTTNATVSRLFQNRRLLNSRALSQRLAIVERKVPQWTNSKALQTTIQQRVARPTSLFALRRSMATVTNETTAYKESPFVQWHLYPDFEKLLSECKPEQAIPVFQQLINATREKFLALEKKFEPTFEGTIGQLSELEDEISRAYGILSHLNGVKNSPELRETLEKIQPEFIKLSLLMNQSVPKYNALEALKNSDEWNKLNKVQRRIVDKALRGMKNAGIGFPENSPEKKRFNEISERLSQLSLSFNNNVLDATKAYKRVVKDRAELEGCSEALLETLKKNGERLGETEGYCITLDFPIYGPFMMNCSNRALREEVYKANITKASEGAMNNEPVINEILCLRREKANLLGYKSHADLSLSVKMAENVESAQTLLDKLFDASIGSAQNEVQKLTQFAATKLGMTEITSLAPWDTAFVSEQYRKELFRFDEETISNYFAFPKVLQGLFDVANEILGIQVRELSLAELKTNNITTWHKDVKVFEVSEQGQVKAYFYGDFYSRPSEKRSGAWMDTVTTRTKHLNGQVTLPVAYLICNQPPPQSQDEPSLMKFRDVETLFHEFGHCLQHMMTRVEYPDASGINGIEWDFVEVASQFMENFCSEPEWLKRLSGHYKTGEEMPQDMVNALVKGREFLSGMAMLRQLHFSKVDLALHSTFTPPKSSSDKSVFDVDAEIAKDTTLIPRLSEDRFLCSFLHIFGGGYSAGYYSYKWSETYSADAYSAFEEASQQGGKPAISQIGTLYRDTILALGGGTPPSEVWKEFRGRDNVDITALLRHSGLLSSSQQQK
ncbi:hypothetical protein BDA99DRAFT_503658 [Phascolomyces articulosus]|uniref:oligopeptidase A n=1 Tax=Phascolomyces articulosus TaxID=60185 RepID=A0AAD5KFS8_9FUNG|nr:hypothetical protein BDA99DRAFT_503658 [Phascolomyces articulosus]